MPHHCAILQNVPQLQLRIRVYAEVFCQPFQSLGVILSWFNRVYNRWQSRMAWRNNFRVIRTEPKNSGVASVVLLDRCLTFALLSSTHVATKCDSVWLVGRVLELYELYIAVMFGDKSDTV